MAMVRSQPELLLRAMLGFMAKQPQEFVLMSVAHITTREHGKVPGLSATEDHPSLAKVF